ncbi:MAG: type II/IV secretion system protein [Candidatus Acididesulfobacter guangdongensis]|uniref:Type II/IV secretion system protein n=1 Tax=Acididesulfobacter guangdongensis TaxID=2597225 RepID=A0A519BFM6_ACIG2|nr:MAG: type II/IV secretion system protein [Candidatus Acididesulfobacter guangdongensis]
MKAKLGELLIKKGITDELTINNALSTQKKLNDLENKYLKLGDILVRSEIITQSQLDDILNEQQEKQDSLVGSSSKLQFEKNDGFIDFLSSEFQELDSDKNIQKTIDQDLIRLIPVSIALNYDIVPYKKENNKLYVFAANLLDAAAEDDLKFYVGCPIEQKIISKSEINQLIGKYYNAGTILNDGGGNKNENQPEAKTELIDITIPDNNKIIQFVNRTISDAIKINASDIHIECYEKELLIRYRLDGKLIEASSTSSDLKNAIISRIKIMANLDISEQRLPQDGHIKVNYKGNYIDLRVSTLPSLYGEKTVLRILDKGAIELNISKLGFSEDNIKILKNAIHKPYGITLVTGPTGSGKTTTLYSALNDLDRKSLNITTVEDPIEYNMDRITQVNVREKINFTFAEVLRALLRQDPDIIMVGEIRDKETAEISIKAALTGHMVLSTIHTNNAILTISRLINMGIDPYLIASSLNLVIAQRLVRKLCPVCKEIDSTYPVRNKNIKVYKKKGCPECMHTGFKGRAAIYEMLEINENISKLIYQNADESRITEYARENGMRFLRDSAIEKLEAGITSYDEISEYLSEEEKTS